MLFLFFTIFFVYNIKNGTEGSINIAIDAIRAASSGHHFLSVTKQGLSAIVATSGNDCCHLILRGGASGPNYSQEHIEESSIALNKAGVNSRLMVDCSVCESLIFILLYVYILLYFYKNKH